MTRVLLLLKLSSRNVFRHRRHSLYALTTIVMGSMGLLVFMGFNRGTMNEYRANTVRARWGHGQLLYVESYRGTGHPRPWETGIEDPGSVMDKLRVLPGVVDLFPRVTLNAMLAAGEKTVAGQGEGIDGIAEARFFTRLNFVEGGDLKDLRSGIVLGRGLAEGLGVRVGDEIQLIVRDKAMIIQGAKVPVTGVFQTGSQEFDSRAFRIPLPVAQALLGTNRVETIAVALSKHDAWPAFARAAKTAVPELEAVPFDELDKVYYRHAVDWLDAQFAFIRGIILFMVFFGTLNAISMIVMERTAEIGTLRANGDSPWEIARGHIIEALMLGFLGSSVGILGGWALSIGPLRNGIAMPPAPGLTVGLRTFIDFDLRDMVQVLLLSIATSVGGCLPPVWRATRIPIAVALRHV